MMGGACVISVLFLFLSVGVKFGRSSKLIMKFPCSPHPALGVAVAEEAGNGFLDVALALKLELELVTIVLLEDPYVDGTF